MKLKIIFLVLAIALCLARGRVAQSTLERVKIAVSSRGIAFIDLYIAKTAAFFAKKD